MNSQVLDYTTLKEFNLTMDKLSCNLKRITDSLIQSWRRDRPCEAQQPSFCEKVLTDARYNLEQ